MIQINVQGLGLIGGAIERWKVDQGNWVKGKGDTNETLHPDIGHAPPIGPHWDYDGQDFPKGVRLFPDGSWENK